MNTSEIITLSASFCALIINALLIVGAILGGNLKEKIYRWFFALLLCNLLGTCCEIIVAFLYGTPGKTVAVSIQVLDFINYACGSLIFISLAYYFYEYLSLKVTASKKTIYLVVFFSIANILLMAVAQYTQIFARLDEHNYLHPTDIIWFTQIMPILSILTLIVATFQKLKSLMPRVWVSLLSYFFIQTVCYVIENVYPNIWVSWFGSIIAIFIIYVNIQLELNQRLKEQELELAESRIAIMLSQIQPHFLYNTLGAIDKLYFENAEDGHNAIVKFASYLRGNMDSLTSTKPIQFSEELAHVKQYLWLEQLRFEEDLQVFYDIQTEAFLVPVLSLQPIVENAVRRGVTKKTGGGSVTVRTSELVHCFKIEVIDDGIGFDPNAPLQDGRGHVGIANVRERLRALCNGTLTIHSAPGEGTVAIIEIPKMEATQ